MTNKPVIIKCLICGSQINLSYQRRDSLFCSNACRQKNHRQKIKVAKIKKKQ